MAFWVIVSDVQFAHTQRCAHTFATSCD